MDKTKIFSTAIYLLRAIVAIVLLQTLYFKFTAHPDSVYIFTTIGLEPFGRIGIGIAELIAAGLLLYGRTAWLGALLTFGIIAGAVLMHLTILGIEVNGDGGGLFYTAIFVLISSAILMYYFRSLIIKFANEVMGNKPALSNI